MCLMVGLACALIHSKFKVIHLLFGMSPLKPKLIIDFLVYSMVQAIFAVIKISSKINSGPRQSHLLYTGLASFTPHDLTLGQAFSNICRNGYRIIAVEAAFQVIAISITCNNARLRRGKKQVNLNFLFFDICIINPVGLF